MRVKSLRPLFASVLLLSLLAAACGDAPPAGEADLETETSALPERLELEGAAAGRNVLILSLDTVRADRLNAYGYEVRRTSPNMDALLGAGTMFAKATSVRALTWPALTSMMTGLYPKSHGVTENGFQRAEDVPTMFQRFTDAGYTTAAVLGNMCNAEIHSFDAYSCTSGEDGKVLQRTENWLQGRTTDGPFVLWVHLFAAHGPYFNGGDRAQELDPGYAGMLGPKKWRLDRVMFEDLELDDADLYHLDALYDAAVIGTDGMVQRILDAFHQVSPPEESVTVFLADHGEDLYDHHGYLYHACSVYESGLHVPLGFTAPGLLPPGVRVEQTVELVDVAPTLLELLGLEPLSAVHGVSLLPYLERHGRGGGAGRPAFSEYGLTNIHTVQSDGWKLVFNPGNESPYCMDGEPPYDYPIQEVELYDLSRDPLEQHNLADDEPARVVRLARLIDERFSDLERRAGDSEMSDELREQLRALGYVAN